MSGAWRLAWRNLRRNRRRNVATGAAIALGYAALVLLFGYKTRIETFVRDAAVYVQHGGHVAVMRHGALEGASGRPAKYALTPAEQAAVHDALAADPRVAFSARYLRGMGLAGNGCRSVPFVALGIEPEVLARIAARPELAATVPGMAVPLQGRPINEYPPQPAPIALSTGLAKRLGKTRVHDELRGAPAAPAVVDCSPAGLPERLAADANVQLAAPTWEGSLNAIDGEVVSVFRTSSVDTEDQTVHAPLAALQQLYDTDGVSYVAAFLHRPDDAPAVAADLRRRLAAAGLAVDVYSYADEAYQPYYAGTMAFISALVVFITTLVTLVVAFGVLNAMTLTVLERSRELGTFRALGWRRRALAGLFLREAALLAGIALGAGLAVAQCAIWGVAAAKIQISPPGIPGTMQVVLTPTPLAFAGLVLLFLPVAALATSVAVRARTRIRPVDLLTAPTT